MQNDQNNQDIEVRKKFALELVRNNDDGFAAARIVFPTNLGAVFWYGNNWQSDEVIAAERDRLLKQGGEDLSDEDLRNKLVRALLNIVEDASTAPEDVAKAANAIGELKGLIHKPNPIFNQTVQAPRVMVVRSHGSNEEWEAKLRKQQDDLINAATN